jgi:hypothetical protein
MSYDTDFDGGKRVVTLPTEPVLDGVLEDDRANVRNVIYVLHARQMCHSWSVTPKTRWYEVVGLVDTKKDCEIELGDLELLKKVDPLRVSLISLRVLGGQNATLSLAINVLRKSEPVVLEEQEIMLIQRKRKFWGVF